MKYFLVLAFLLPSVSFAAPLTQDQATSLISVVQSSPGTPASAFTDLITAFSSISVSQAESLINVIQQAPGAPAEAFMNLLISFTVDPAPTIQATVPESEPAFGGNSVSTPAPEEQPAAVVPSEPMDQSAVIVKSVKTLPVDKSANHPYGAATFFVSVLDGEGSPVKMAEVTMQTPDNLYGEVTRQANAQSGPKKNDWYATFQYIPTEPGTKEVVFTSGELTKVQQMSF